MDAAAGKSSVAAELKDVVSRNYALLIVVPAVVALLVWAGFRASPTTYTSEAILMMDETTARSADALMSSEPVRLSVLKRLNIPVDSDQASGIASARSLTVAPGDAQKSPTLFRLAVVNRDPRTAMEINRAYLDAWFAATSPREQRHKEIEADTARLQGMIQSIEHDSKLLDQLDWWNVKADVGSARDADPVTQRVAALNKLDQIYGRLDRLRMELRGVSSDVIFGPPTLPTKPDAPPRGLKFIVASVGVSELLLLAVLLLRQRRAAPSL